MSKIVVIGSSNTDLVVHAHAFPKPGETLMGNSFQVYLGGKGANQAVAASRLGGEVCFVAKVGDDNYGNKAIDAFLNDNIDTKYVFKDKEAASGVAVITINEEGQNVIVVVSGANMQLSPVDINQTIEDLKQASIILVQLEISMQTVKHVLELASKYNKRVVLNPAPAIQLEREMYKKIFLITPNETEASLLTGIDVCDIETAAKAASMFLDWQVDNVIITMGGKGAFFKNKSEMFHVPANKTKIIDTTAAGDVFNGAITVALTENKTWREAITYASMAASIAVSRKGAQPSIPYKGEVEKILNNNC